MKFSLRVSNEDLSAYSGWFLAWGVALVILGLLAIGASTFTTLLSIVFIGVIILLSGVVILIDTFTFWWGQWSGFLLHLLLGALYFVVGVMLISNPVEGSLSITFLLGLFYILVGITRIFYSLAIRLGRWQWSFFNGLLSLVLGILITGNLPTASLFVIGLFIGIDLVFSGWTYITASLFAKKLAG